MAVFTVTLFIDKQTSIKSDFYGLARPYWDRLATPCVRHYYTATLSNDRVSSLPKLLVLRSKSLRFAGQLAGISHSCPIHVGYITINFSRTAEQNEAFDRALKAAGSLELCSYLIKRIKSQAAKLEKAAPDPAKPKVMINRDFFILCT